MKTKTNLPLTNLIPALVCGVCCLFVLGVSVLTEPVRPSFWFDEVLTMKLVQGVRPEIYPYIWQEANMWFYFLCMKVWVLVADSEHWVRFFSTVCSVGSIVMMYKLARNWFGIDVAILATVFLSVNGFFLQYAQEARSYALYLFLTIVSMWYFEKYYRIPEKPSHWWGYVISTILLIYTHLFGVLIFLSHSFLLVLTNQGRLDWKNRAMSFLVISISIIPLYIASSVNPVNWLTPLNSEKIFSLFHEYSGGMAFISVPLAVWSCFRLFFPSLDLQRKVVMFWFFIPVGFVVLFSIFVRSIFVDRYLFMTLPAFILILSLGLTFIKPRFLFFVLFAFLLSRNLDCALYTVGFNRNQENWKGILQCIVGKSKIDEPIIFYPNYLSDAFNYYGPRLFPQRPSSHSIIQLVDYPYSESEKKIVPLFDRKKLALNLQGHDRFWVVTSDFRMVVNNVYIPESEILNIVSVTHEKDQEWIRGKLKLILFSRHLAEAKQ